MPDHFTPDIVEVEGGAAKHADHVVINMLVMSAKRLQIEAIPEALMVPFRTRVSYWAHEWLRRYPYKAPQREEG